MKTINLQTARNFIISSQLPFSNKGITTTHDIIEHLGYVQIDTISVVARAHHHVLWTRVPGYSTEHLHRLLKEKKVFDYWAHAASYLPMCDYRFSLVRKQQIQKSDKHWYKKDSKLMKKVLERFKVDGALMSRDFEKTKEKATHPWHQHPVKQAIMHLFMEGKLMIVERKGFQKKYDLTERVLPNNINTKTPTRKEYLEYLVKRDLRAHGLMKVRDFGHLLKIDRKELKTHLEKMVKSGELEDVRIKGLEGEPFFAIAKDLENFKPSRKKSIGSRGQFHILSPFDNLIIQRKRVKELFDFEYVLECYVSAAKRKVGYFSLPMLYGNELVGQIDLKADRKTKVLWVRNLVWEKGIKKTDTMREAFQNKLNEFMEFNGCEVIQTEKEITI